MAGAEREARVMAGYSDTRHDHLRRLRRIEDGSGACSGRVEEDGYCVDILTRVSAANGALRSFALALLDEHLAHCVAAATAKGGTEPPPDPCLAWVGETTLTASHLFHPPEVAPAARAASGLGRYRGTPWTSDISFSPVPSRLSRRWRLPARSRPRRSRRGFRRRCR